MVKEFNIAKVNIECEAQAHRILNCYIRYMFKKLKIRKYDHSVFYTCSRYENYILHINGLLLKSRELSFYNYKSIRYLPSKCYELDILVERFVLRNYKIKLIYDKNYKKRGKYLLKTFSISIVSLIRDIVFDLKSLLINTSKISSKRSTSLPSSNTFTASNFCKLGSIFWIFLTILKLNHLNLKLNQTF